MDKQILVSIVTIVYNGETHLEETILSVLRQGYTNIEYLIIDGGSTDGTLDIIKKYEKDLVYWTSEKDKGISDAFNKGILVAKGELIGLINCGDYYEPDAIENVVNSYHNPDDGYVVLHGNIRMFNHSGSKIYAPLPLNTFRYQMPVWHPTIFANRKVYRDFSYDLNYKIAMDYELFSRVYKSKGKFVTVNSLITNMNTDGVSNHQAAKGFKEVMVASRLNLKMNSLASYFYYYYRVALNRLITIAKDNV